MKRQAALILAGVVVAGWSGRVRGRGRSEPAVCVPDTGLIPGSPRQPSASAWQVRLRRYLVTEVVTETEAGQQHELRVEQVPISDQDLDAVTAPPGQPEASVQPESPAPASNDWFRPEGDPPR